MWTFSELWKISLELCDLPSWGVAFFRAFLPHSPRLPPALPLPTASLFPCRVSVTLWAAGAGESRAHACFIPVLPVTKLETYSELLWNGCISLLWKVLPLYRTSGYISKYFFFNCRFNMHLFFKILIKSRRVPYPEKITFGVYSLRFLFPWICNFVFLCNYFRQPLQWWICIIDFHFVIQVDVKHDILLLFLFLFKIVLFFHIHLAQNRTFYSSGLFFFEREREKSFLKALPFPPSQVTGKGCETAMIASGLSWFTSWCWGET